MVQAFEVEDARLMAGYTIPAWESLSSAERAREVALYRIRSVKRLVEDLARVPKKKGR